MVADYFSKEIDNCSVFIPSSVQQKGIDLLLYKYSNGVSNVVTIQVKMSRTYYDKNRKDYEYKLWFNRYDVPDNADWNILVGIYPEMVNTKNVGQKTKWSTIMLAFKKGEMKTFMSQIRQKRDPTKLDKMFGFGFNDKSAIYQTRGCFTDKDVSCYLIDKRINDIKKALH